MTSKNWSPVLPSPSCIPIHDDLPKACFPITTTINTLFQNWPPGWKLRCSSSKASRKASFPFFEIATLWIMIVLCKVGVASTQGKQSSLEGFKTKLRYCYRHMHSQNVWNTVQHMDNFNKEKDYACEHILQSMFILQIQTWTIEDGQTGSKLACNCRKGTDDAWWCDKSSVMLMKQCVLDLPSTP